MTRIYKFILLLLAILGFKVESVPVKKIEPNTQVKILNNNFPYLNLPDEYQYASYDDESTYRSYPSVNLTIKEYDNNKHKLSLPKPLSEILKDDSLSASYLPEDYISTKEEFDVDTDGKNETIVSIGSTGSNHPPLYSEIIKDGYVIFSVREVQPRVLPSETNNGFYVQWYKFDKHFGDGMCCPSGYTKTRFVYKDGKFAPIWEQEVIYTKVGNPNK